MSKHLFVLLVLSIQASISYSQCEDGRYTEFIFPSWEVTTDVVYGQNLDLNGANEQLKMDVYVPSGDASTSRALVVLCHGGYFLFGDKAEADVLPFCHDLTRMGYVVASINYRMGIQFQFPLNEPYGRAVVRAVQDARAAIRWFRQDVAAGNQFGIDPTQVYVGGDSAGGVLSIHLAYMDEEEVPDYIDMSYPGLEGGLEGNSGNPGYSSDVNAIFSISGAIGDTTWIDAGEKPVCLFHGSADTTVPFDSGTFYLFGLTPVVDLDGSNAMDPKLTEVGIEHCFEINEGLGHVAYMGNAAVYDTTLSILTGFLSHFICGSELTCEYNAIGTSVVETSKENLQLFPNPAKHNVRVNSGFNGPSVIDIFDATGRLTFHTSGMLPLELNIENYFPGMYVVQVRDALGVHRQKLVVE